MSLSTVCIDAIKSFFVTMPVSPDKCILLGLIFNPLTRAFLIANKSFLHIGKEGHLIVKYSHTPTNNTFVVHIVSTYLLAILIFKFLFVILS